MVNIAITQSKVSIAYSTIKNKIFSGEYPFGKVLSSKDLASELGMSRTPILDAFKALEKEGMVAVVPQVGIVVKPIDNERIYGMFVSRATLEGIMAAEATNKKTKLFEDKLKQFISEMQFCIDNENSKRYAELNIEFHMTIIEQAQIPFIAEMISQLWDQSRYLSVQHPFFEDNKLNSFNEHKEIMDAILTDNSKKARDIMERHILNAMKILFMIMEKK